LLLLVVVLFVLLLYSQSDHIISVLQPSSVFILFRKEFANYR